MILRWPLQQNGSVDVCMLICLYHWLFGSLENCLSWAGVWQERCPGESRRSFFVGFVLSVRVNNESANLIIPVCFGGELKERIKTFWCRMMPLFWSKSLSFMVVRVMFVPVHRHSSVKTAYGDVVVSSPLPKLQLRAVGIRPAGKVTRKLRQ